MGWSLSKDCSFEFQGVQTLVSPDGNNVAWACPCGGPVLFVYQNGRRGSGPSAAARCPKCAAEYFLQPSFGTLPEPASDKSVAPADIIQIVKK